MTFILYRKIDDKIRDIIEFNSEHIIKENVSDSALSFN